MQSMRIQIKNYQRVRDAKLEFIPGLNVIQGASNNGKTAILRALETAIYNIPRESHVTLGETTSAVGIQYNDHEVIWRRDKNAASQVTYRVDGKIYSKCGRGQLDLVADALNMREIEVNGRKFRVNFGKQMSYPFLLDCTPSEFFKFIVQTGEENITAVLDTMRKDFSDMKSNIKGYESSVNSLGTAYQNEAKAYNALREKVQYAKQILELDGKVQQYTELLNQVNTLKKSIEITSTLGVEVTKYTEQYNYLNEVYNSLMVKRGMSDELRDTTQSYQSNLDTVNNTRVELQNLIDFTNRVQDLPVYRNKLNSVQILQAKRDSIEVMMQSTKRYVRDIEDSTPKLQNIKSFLGKADDALEFVGRLKEEVISTEEARDTLREQSLEVFRVNKAIEDLQSRIDASERIIKEVEVQLQEFPVCMHCGAPIVNGHYCKEE